MSDSKDNEKPEIVCDRKSLQHWLDRSLFDVVIKPHLEKKDEERA